MSESATKMTIDVPDYTQGTTINTQYGMRFPDGTISWVTVPIPGLINPLKVQAIHDGRDSSKDHWAASLKHRAEAARIDFDEYKEGHDIVKRTVILVTTDIEEA